MSPFSLTWHLFFRCSISLAHNFFFSSSFNSTLTRLFFLLIFQCTHFIASFHLYFLTSFRPLPFFFYFPFIFFFYHRFSTYLAFILFLPLKQSSYAFYLSTYLSIYLSFLLAKHQYHSPYRYLSSLLCFPL